MLQDFRESMKGIAFFIVILIIIPFAFVGVDSIFSGGPAGGAEISVDGEEISRITVERALVIQTQRLAQQFGSSFDPALLDSGMLRGMVRQRLINEKGAELSALNGEMGVSPATIAALLQAVEAYQVDGVFDVDTYKAAIRQMRFTSREHRDYMKNGLLLSQFSSGVVNTGFVTDADLALSARIFEQRRNYYYLTLPVAASMDAVSITDEDIQSYYDGHREQFQTEEKVEVSYIQLTVDDLLDLVEVDADEVQRIFKEEQQSAQRSERRRSEHILIEKASDGSHSKRIEELKQEMKAGVDFADLAKKYSDDLGSAAEGGDLGFMELDALPSAFSLALKGLTLGEVSGPVETESGIHFIRLAELEQGEVLVFEEEKARIEQKLQSALAADLLPEKIEELRERTYNAESLDEPAEEMGLQVVVTPAFSRSGGEGLAGYPAIVDAAFQEDVLLNGYTSDVLEFGDSVVVLKVHKHHPASFSALAVVQDEIRVLLKREHARTSLIAGMAVLQARAREGQGIEAIAKQEGLQWQVSLDTSRFDKNVEQAIQREAFELPAGGPFPAINSFELANGDYVLLSVTAVNAGDLSKFQGDKKRGLEQSTARALAQREYQDYESLILAGMKIKMDSL